MAERSAPHYAGVVITQVEPVQTIDGTATKVLLRLAYGPHTHREGLPDQLCVKGWFGAYREYLGGMGLYASEVRFSVRETGRRAERLVG